MDNKFENVVEVICANPRQAGTFIIPALNKQSKEAIVNSKDFPEIIAEFYDWCDLILKGRGISTEMNWWQLKIGYDVFKQLLSELLYDGQGYFVPAFEGYIQKDGDEMRQNLTTILVPAPGGKQTTTHAYDMDADDKFNSFLHDVFDHADNIEAHIRTRRGELGHKVEEKTEELNTDGKAKREMAKPYEEEVIRLTKEKGL